MLAFLAPWASAYRVHTVFCAECTNNFDYKSIAAFWSHNVSGMPGGITRCAHNTLHGTRFAPLPGCRWRAGRLLACDEAQLKHYKGMNIGPTFVHKNHGHVSHKRTLGPGETEFPAGARASDMSPSYNKPGSIMHWVQESEEAKSVDYVLYIDADMLLRRPMDPVALEP